jgi:molecular chaperone Hsp33
MATGCIHDYLPPMTNLPAFLDSNRPDVPDLAVSRGITPFFLPQQPVRGRLIRLGPLANTLLTRHDHKDVVRKLLGEALALAASLAAALKFSGSFSVQAKGDGAVSMLLADCTDIGALRGYARVNTEKMPLGETLTARDLLGNGYLAFTVDQGPEREPQQGIVALEGETLAEMAEHYFATSEQLACRVHLAAGNTAAGWRASALILERVAGAGGIGALTAAEQDEAWRTACILANTVTSAELLDDELLPDRLLYRLFNGEGVAVDRPRTLAYGCRCSRARLADILEGFPRNDLDDMVVDGDIVMTCEFCNFDFRFPRDTVTGRQGVSP